MDDLFPSNSIVEKIYEKKSEGFKTEQIEIGLFNQLIESMSQIQKYCDVIILYTSLKDSVEELARYLDNIIFGGEYREYAKANRLTLNMLSSFYSLIEFCEKNISKFKDKYKRDLYDNNFSYRLFYYLRIYMAHKSLGVTSFQMTINESSMITTANIDVEKIINYEKINKKFRDELSSLGKKSISINDYIKDFENVVNQFAFIIFKNEGDSILNNFKFIKENIPNSNERLCECFIKDENGKPHSLLKNITNFVEIYSKGLIYRNKIETNPDVSPECYALFMVVSFLYFNQKGVVVKPDDDK